MKMIFKYLGAVKITLIITLVIKTFASLIELAIPYILSHILDDVVPSRNVSSILFWGGAMIFCALAAFIGNVVANRNAARVARDVTKRTRQTLFERTMRLSSHQIDEFTIPSLESRLTSDTFNINSFIVMSLRMGIRAPIILIGGVIITVTLDPVLTLVMLVMLPLIGGTIFIVTKKGVPLFKKNQASLDSMIRVVREDAQGIRVIKALSKVDYERRRYDDANKALIKDEIHASSIMAVSNPLVTLFLNIGLVSVVVVGAIRVNADLTGPGVIIAFIQYFTIISNAMLGLSRIFVNSTKGIASAQRIEEVINTEPDLLLESEDKYPQKKSKGYISFENVGFSYRKKNEDISDISFELERGQSLGIIGATGSGKSTVLQLLMRLYDVDRGNVRIDGRDVRTIPHEELNSMFGVVMQNDFIFAGSVRDNIDFGRGLSDEDIRRAVHTAQAAEFIEAYDDGYDHALNSKGTNLSGGQRQRLLISRALAGSPKVLVLDDSSSALDYKTDSKLRRAIKQDMAGVTTVTVAQRVSSVMHCDLILVLEEGRIIGKGTHSELLETCEVYKEISDSQVGGAILE